MARYCITAARPKKAEHDLKSEFKLWKREETEDGTWKWFPQGWKRAAEIAALLDADNQVLTAQESEKSTTTGAKSIITTGAAVELELRIAKNETNYKISNMPDK